MPDATGEAAPGPLAGLRVIDCATLFAGPIVATLLGDFGADVIKIEHPSGDPLRNMGLKKDGHGLWWKVAARNKRCIALDLKQPDDADIFKRLVAEADVLVENFRTGTLETWGLGWDTLAALNPRLVMVRVTGFGQTGPYRRRAGFGTLAEAISGFAHITGEPDGPPTLPPFGLADGVAAYFGCFAAMFALYERDAKGSAKGSSGGSGLGQFIDLAIYEPIFALLGPQSTVFDQLGIIQNRTGNRSVNNAPRNAYQTRDGRWVALSAAAPSIVRRVLELTGGPGTADDPRFRTNLDRVKHVEIIDGIVGGWIARHDLAAVVETFEQVEAAIAPIYDIAQIFTDPQYRARESVTTVEDSDLGPLRMPNVFPRLSRTPGRIRFAGARIDQHREEILAELASPGGAEGRPWDRYLGEQDRAVLARGGFAKRMGFGARPAIVAIDCQRYMLGERGVSDDRFPSSCGAAGWAAVDRIAAILKAGRAAGVPVFLTRFALDPAGADIGVYGLKRAFLDRPDWCLEGSPGAELLPEIGPEPGDIVVVKKKPSGFFGTPLLSYLVDRRIDTVIVLGGATSNCVRATVFDAASLNFRAIVPMDAVFDRVPVSHAISLFDMDRQFADVVSSDEILAHLAAAGR
jgi:crotonobetainyl-CoA:carnitine CoA-transferase CaiB-like acyl-CoA transferase/nicotinamidase-related amidase